MIELLTTGEMRAVDRRTIAAGTPSLTLMERAGAAVAERAASLVATGGRVLVLCGPGANGGDGFVAARLLAERGHGVELALLGEPSALRGDAATAASAWTGPVGSIEEVCTGEADLIVDALFGAGLSRPVEGAARALIERVNAARRPVLAVDVPSGVEGDTGAVRGVVIRATATVTFVRRKPGHLLMPGRALCGDVTVADIGAADDTVARIGSKAVANEPAAWAGRFPRPGLAGHKYGRGHALVLSGPATRTGAARLAARGALRVGSGLVTVAAPTDALAENAAHLTAVMLRACDGPDGLAALLADKRFNAVAAGPGLGVGEGTRNLVRVAVEARRACVLDADAITSHEGYVADLAALLVQTAYGQVVLTPHQGEIERLFRDMPEVLTSPSKLERARAAAKALHAVVVYKGPDTVVAAPDGCASINATGTPYLATAGTGDVLTGFIAGLMAQGMPGFEAASCGVWLHGVAGSRIGPGLIAEDLPEVMREVLGSLA